MLLLKTQNAKMHNSLRTAEIIYSFCHFFLLILAKQWTKWRRRRRFYGAVGTPHSVVHTISNRWVGCERTIQYFFCFFRSTLSLNALDSYIDFVSAVIATYLSVNRNKSLIPFCHINSWFVRNFATLDKIEIERTKNSCAVVMSSSTNQ